MTKNLVLVRHAKAMQAEFGGKDFDRTLNEKGITDAMQMGNKMANKFSEKPVFVSSSAMRTLQTAQLFAEQFKIEAHKIICRDEIYEASTRILLNEITLLDANWNTVFMFGHNPGISYLAENLTKEYLAGFPTCGVVSIAFEVENWSEISSGTGKMLFYEYPNS
jgi:phosphohistidine phosphatase